MNNIEATYDIPTGGKYANIPSTILKDSNLVVEYDYCPVCTGHVIIKDLNKTFCGYCNTEIKKVDKS